MATGEDWFWIVDMLVSRKGEAQLREGREYSSAAIFVAAVAGENRGELQRETEVTLLRLELCLFWHVQA